MIDIYQKPNLISQQTLDKFSNAEDMFNEQFISIDQIPEKRVVIEQDIFTDEILNEQFVIADRIFNEDPMRIDTDV